MTGVTTAVGTLEAWDQRIGGYLEPTPSIYLLGSISGVTARNEISCDLTAGRDFTPLIGPRRNSLRFGFTPMQGELTVPWVFRPARTVQGIISSTGLGATASGFVLAGAPAIASVSTAIHPSRAALLLIQREQSTSHWTSLWYEPNALRVLAPGLEPRTIYVSQGARDAVTQSSAAFAARQAVEDLMRWLRMTPEEVADLCGFAKRSFHNWIAGMQPRPNTVRKLHDVHALVAALIQRLGPDRTILWLSEPLSGGRTRLGKMRDERVQSVIRDARGFLFASPPRVKRPAPERDQSVIDAEEPQPVGGHVLGAPHRPRRPGAPSRRD
jgi:hypothetical protein